MAQKKQLTWSDMRVGLFVLASLIIIVLAIFFVTGGNILGPKYKLFTYQADVEGLQAGAPVNLDGVQIGSVQSIELAPNPPDRQHGIKLVLRIDRKYQGEVRTDSSAGMATQGLLGDSFVAISRGLTGTPIPENGVVPGSNEPGMKEAVLRGSDLMVKLSALSDDLRGIVGQIQNGNGTLSKLLKDPALYDNLNSTAGKLDAVATSIQKGQGSLGKLVSTDELYTKADSAVGKLDDVLGAVRDQKGTVGKLVYDPSAYDSIKKLADNGNAVLGDVRAGKGTLGKLATDDTIFVNLRDASAKLNSNQGTMGKMFTDPGLYDNMTGLTGDLRALIGDFRQDPKKFLHIRVGVF